MHHKPNEYYQLAATYSRLQTIFRTSSQRPFLSIGSSGGNKYVLTEVSTKPSCFKDLDSSFSIEPLADPRRTCKLVSVHNDGAGAGSVLVVMLGCAGDAASPDRGDDDGDIEEDSAPESSSMRVSWLVLLLLLFSKAIACRLAVISESVRRI